MTTSSAAARALAMVGVVRDDVEPETPSLPLELTRLFTLDDIELHDLVYHAATQYLTQLSGMTRERAHLHAGRIADRATANALASDYVHLGADPRA